MGEDEILTIIEKYSSHPNIVAIRNDINDPGSRFEFVSVSDEYVYGLLKGMDTKKSVVYDIYLVNFLKVVLFRWPDPSLISLIWAPTNASSRIIGNLVNYRRYIREEMTYKKNYRPVCILIAMSKIFERSMSDQMATYFQNIFSKFLSAFRRKYGCQSALVRMCEEWMLSLDKGESIGSIAMDLSRAFVSVTHGLLIAKFHAYGASTTACKLLASYLSNRFQRIKLNGDKSEWLRMTRGFPHGSILGLLLFNIFFNDIFYFHEKCNLYNYADDNDDNVCSFAGRDVSYNV